MNDIPPGWIKVKALYRCKWCERKETILLHQGPNVVVHGIPHELDGWRTYDQSYGFSLDLCSSDCQKERDEAYNKALAACEPVPHYIPEELDAKVEEFRQEALRLRRQAHDDRV